MDPSLRHSVVFSSQTHAAQTWSELEQIFDRCQAAFTAGELTRDHCERVATGLVERSREIPEVAVE